MNPQRRNWAFSLVELLVVMALISVLIALATGGMSNIGAGRAMDNSGSLLSNLIQQAQQTSTAKNVMTMLVVVPDSEGRHRLVTLLEYPLGASSWTQTSRWDRFSEGVFLDADASDLPSLSLRHSPFPLKYSGREIGEAAALYLVFLPGGGLLGGDNALCRLSLLSRPNGSLDYTVRINASTGACAVERL